MSTRYAEKADLIALAVSASVLESIDDATINGHLDAASSKADSYIRSRYKPPLATWGDDLRQAVCSIAAYSLIASKGTAPDDQSMAIIADRHNSAIKWLVDVSAGRATLNVVDTAPAVTQGPRVHSKPKRGW